MKKKELIAYYIIFIKEINDKYNLILNKYKSELSEKNKIILDLNYEKDKIYNNLKDEKNDIIQKFKNEYDDIINKLNNEIDEKNNIINSFKDEKNKIINNNYDDKCYKILNNNNNDEEYLYKMNIIENKIKETLELNEKKYLKEKKILLKIKNNLLKTLYNNNTISYCKEIKDVYENNNQKGGNNYNYEYKIGKYIKTNKNNKIIKYIKKYNQNGGEISENIIEKILKNEYTLITDNKIYKSYQDNDKIKRFSNNNNNIDNDNIYITKNLNTPYLYFNNNLNNKEENENKILYYIKYNIKLFMTDIFIQKTLNNDLYNEIGLYVYYELNVFINEFIFKYNKIIKNDKKKINNEDIYLLYKNGNTINIYIKKLIENINKIDIESFELINNIYGSNINKGDFDFNICINNKLLKEKLDKNEINKLYDYVNNAIIIPIINIKEILKLLINNTLNNDYMNNIINNLSTLQNIINNYKLKFNELFDDKKIQNINIDKINLKNIYYKDNKIINNYDYVSKIKSHIYNYANTNYNKLDYINNFLSNEKLSEFYPDYISNNNVYFLYIKNINFQSLYNIIKFSLYRIKFENYINLDINYDNIKSENLKILSSIDLIDISIDDNNLFNKIDSN